MAGSLNLKAEEESFICDCKDTYTDNRLVIQDLDKKAFKEEL